MKEIIERAAAKGAAKSEVFFLNSLRTEVSFEANRLKSVSRTEERGVALRVVKDGRVGLATSTRLDDPDRIASDALATAAYGDEVGYDFAGEAQTSPISTSDAVVAGLDVEAMMTRAKDGIARLLDYEPKINAESETTRDVQEIHVLTSEGFESSFERTLYQFELGGRLIQGTSFLDCGGYYGGTELDAEGRQLVDRVIEDFKNGRTEVGVSSGPTTVLLTPRAVADVMMTLHHATSGLMVERQISPLTGRLGETVFDERISIYDDGLAGDGYESAPFDDEGVPMQRTPIVEAGVLEHFLTDLRTAAKLDLPRTGNGLRRKRLFLTKDVGAVPAPGITNWEMCAGETPKDELISEMGSGVIVDRIMGILMSNLLAGDFSGNVAYGLKVEDGSIRGRVKDTMVAGNVYRLLKDNVVALSSDIERVGLLGGIGSHRFPYLLLRDVSISTKG